LPYKNNKRGEGIPLLSGVQKNVAHAGKAECGRSLTPPQFNICKSHQPAKAKEEIEKISSELNRNLLYKG
jgi:hypothetical protein